MEKDKQETKNGSIDWFDEVTAAMLLGLKKSTLANLRLNKRAPAHSRVGKSYLYSKETITKWLEQNATV
jgi:excisionase family DNA binding protein